MKKILMSVLLAASFAAPLAANAQICSSRITIVVGFTPGGSNDVIARILAPKLSENLSVPVIVENRPGAGSKGTSDANRTLSNPKNRMPHSVAASAPKSAWPKPARGCATT